MGGLAPDPSAGSRAGGGAGSGPDRGCGPNQARVTGLVLAGGLGRRMGGVNKGLQPFQGQALAQHALTRLRPQVDTVALNANRHLDQYAAWSVPVWEDTMPGHLGPLSGFLTGLERMSTPWLVTVPCDVPGFPTDLVERLVAAAERHGAQVAVAAAGRKEGHAPASVDEDLRRHPVFCLIHRDLLAPLRLALQDGERRVDRWTASCHRVVVPFADARAFENLNTLDDLKLHQGPQAETS